MAGRSGLRVALLAAIFSVAASKPIVQPINDVTMKACPTSTCTPVNVQITVGHQTPDFDITKLSITEIKITPLNPLQDAPFSAVISVRSDGTQRVIALSPKGKIFGTARITGAHIPSFHRRSFRHARTQSEISHFLSDDLLILDSNHFTRRHCIRRR